MDITIAWTFLPHTDPEASLAFYRDTLGFEVRKDVGNGTMRWLTVGPPDQPDTSIVLHPPTDETGNSARIVLASKDLDSTFERLRAGGAKVAQEPTDHKYGIRDCAFHDPAGNEVRIIDGSSS
jgi:predicted enzyme related to lactoylglutathione lyase